MPPTLAGWRPPSRAGGHRDGLAPTVTGWRPPCWQGPRPFGRPARPLPPAHPVGGRLGSPCRPILSAHVPACADGRVGVGKDRKSTRLNSSHVAISYAVFCLKKKKN